MILACDNGRLDVDVNGARQHLETFEALILPPRTRLSNHMGSPGVRCDLAVIANDVVKRLLGGRVEEWDRCIYVYKTNHVRADEKEREQFAGYVGTLSYKLGQQQRHTLLSAQYRYERKRNMRRPRIPQPLFLREILPSRFRIIPQ